MLDPAAIRDLAGQRLAEALILLDHDHLQGALYLAGYCVELELKAKLCERFEVPNLFYPDEALDSSFPGIGHCRAALKIHDLKTLLIFCGLSKKLASSRRKALHISLGMSLLLEHWSEKLRYRQKSPLSQDAVQQVIDALGSQNGIIQWIRNN